MKLTLTRKHHLVTEKYGHLDIEATVEVDSETDDLHGFGLEEFANVSIDALVNPTIERLNRSLDQPGDDEFVRAWVNSREV